MDAPLSFPKRNVYQAIQEGSRLTNDRVSPCPSIGEGWALHPMKMSQKRWPTRSDAPLPDQFVGSDQPKRRLSSLANCVRSLTTGSAKGMPLIAASAAARRSGSPGIRTPWLPEAGVVERIA